MNRRSGSDKEMKDELKAVVEGAIAPLQQEIEILKAQVAALAPPAKMAKQTELPAPVREALEVLNHIPQETLIALEVVKVGFDGTKCWMSLLRANGTSVSIKKTATAFRVRWRGHSGKLLKELNPSFNGLNAALQSLA